MARDFDQRGKQGPKSLLERQEQARAAQRRNLAQHKQRLEELSKKAKSEQPPQVTHILRDSGKYVASLQHIPFHQLDRPERLRPSAPYRRLVDITLAAINSASRQAVLCWPDCQPSPAAIVALIALADCDGAQPIQHNGYNALSAPQGLRALVYPYARTAHRPLRHIFVDKEYVGRVQLLHQIRCSGPDEDPALADFHKTLARVRSLTGRARDGKVYPEFVNPCLDELLPSGPCTGVEGRSQLLWRVRSKTDLKSISRSGVADDPSFARFYLFGVRSNENIEQSIKGLNARPDITILQLDFTGRNRLGKDWESRVRNFLRAVNRRFENVPVVALTDDPWTFDKLRFDVLWASPRKQSEGPTPSNVVFATEPEIIVAEDKLPASYASISNCDVIAYAGEVEVVLGRLRSARRTAAELGDVENADRLGALVGVIRRCASLPGSRSSLATYIEDESDLGPLAAADLLVAYRIGALTKELSESTGSWAQIARDELNAICERVRAVWDNTDILTPMAPLLKDVVSKFLRASSRTVILFQNDMLADFAAHTLQKETDIGETVSRRIDNGMIRFLDRAGFDDLENLPRMEKSHIKTLVLVAPSRSTLLRLLSKPWLPQSIIVLADADTLEGAARDAHRLGSYPDLIQLKLRFTEFSKSAAAAVQRVRGSSVVLDQLIEASDDVDLPGSGIVNLAGHVRPDQTIYRIELEGGQVILAKPGTKLVLQEVTHVIPLFEEVEARSVEIGDRICVIGEAFLEMARPLINITLRAAEEIRDYHKLVLERFAAIPGDSNIAKLRTVVEKMGLPNVTPQRASYWVDLDEQLNASLDDVVPHAPLDYATFRAFMSALSIGETVAKRYWTWAVIAQRSNRLRAGMSIRDAYRGILVDAYAAQSDNPTRVQEVRRLRAAAENFVGIVRKKAEVRGENARA